MQFLRSIPDCRRTLRPALVAGLFALAGSGWLAAQTGTLAADTAVTSVHPATNYGSLSNLYVSSTSTALLRFDLGTVLAPLTSAGPRCACLPTASTRPVS